MESLLLHELHHELGAHFDERDGAEVVGHYGDVAAEHAALRQHAGVLDLSFRGRLCLTGTDRVRFLHGQVTNDVKKLRVGEGCYAALVTAKGKMESDLNIFCLQDELLLDFEPGLSLKVAQRLEKFIVSDDVQIVEAAPHYGLLTVQGPKSDAVIRALGLFAELPAKALASIKVSDATLGDIYLMNHARLGSAGFDLFVPNAALGAVADKLIAAAKAAGGRACGWQAFDEARIEAGIPRYGVDMNETILPLEAGLEARAVSYSKGCYIGQEVLNRIHSMGQVAKELRGLRLLDSLVTLPQKGDRLFQDDKEVGYVTSAVRSRSFSQSLVLGYVRREINQPGAELTLRTTAGECRVRVVALPFAL
ncbi:MAG: glycine cleavage T C-terminal barrel domain-containing protein [Verrucomicrobiota bacterium]